MRKEIWNNCPITAKNSIILRKWFIGSENHTGIDIECSEVYTICDGVIIQCGQSNNKTFSCIIQYSSKQCIKYSNLNRLYVDAGQTVESGQYIGTCKQYVHFEYLVTAQSNPVFPVRVGTQTYFKVDPQCIVDGSIVLSGSGLKNVTYIDRNSNIMNVDITDSMNSEFTGNRGDE